MLTGSMIQKFAQRFEHLSKTKHEYPEIPQYNLDQEQEEKELQKDNGDQNQNDNNFILEQELQDSQGKELKNGSTYGKFNYDDGGNDEVEVVGYEGDKKMLLDKIKSKIAILKQQKQKPTNSEQHSKPSKTPPTPTQKQRPPTARLSEQQVQKSNRKKDDSSQDSDKQIDNESKIGQPQSKDSNELSLKRRQLVTEILKATKNMDIGHKISYYRNRAKFQHGLSSHQLKIWVDAYEMIFNVENQLKSIPEPHEEKLISKKFAQQFMKYVKNNVNQRKYRFRRICSFALRELNLKSQKVDTWLNRFMIQNSSLLQGVNLSQYSLKNSNNVQKRDGQGHVHGVNGIKPTHSQQKQQIVADKSIGKDKQKSDNIADKLAQKIRKLANEAKLEKSVNQNKKQIEVPRVSKKLTIESSSDEQQRKQQIEDPQFSEEEEEHEREPRQRKRLKKHWKTLQKQQRQSQQQQVQQKTVSSDKQKQKPKSLAQPQRGRPPSKTTSQQKSQQKPYNLYISQQQTEIEERNNVNSVQVSTSKKLKQKQKQKQKQTNDEPIPIHSKQYPQSFKKKVAARLDSIFAQIVANVIKDKCQEYCVEEEALREIYDFNGLFLLRKQKKNDVSYNYADLRESVETSQVRVPETNNYSSAYSYDTLDVKRDVEQKYYVEPVEPEQLQQPSPKYNIPQKQPTMPRYPPYYQNPQPQLPPPQPLTPTYYPSIPQVPHFPPSSSQSTQIHAPLTPPTPSSLQSTSQKQKRQKSMKDNKNMQRLQQQAKVQIESNKNNRPFNPFDFIGNRLVHFVRANTNCTEAAIRDQAIRIASSGEVAGKVREDLLMKWINGFIERHREKIDKMNNQIPLRNGNNPINPPIRPNPPQMPKISIKPPSQPTQYQPPPQRQPPTIPPPPHFQPQQNKPSIDRPQSQAQSQYQNGYDQQMVRNFNIPIPMPMGMQNLNSSRAEMKGYGPVRKS